MSNKKEVEKLVEQQIFERLKKLIHKDLEEFLSEILNGNEKEIQQLIKDYIETENKFKKSKKELENLIEQYKKKYNIEEMSLSNILKPEEYEIFYKGNIEKDLQITERQIKLYAARKRKMRVILKQIVPYMLKFQNKLSERLKISISFVLTRGDTTSYKTYDSENINIIRDILHISAQDIKIIDKNLDQIEGFNSSNEKENTTPLVALITQEVNKLKKNKYKIINAITNEESTYNEVVDRYINGSNRHNIYWQIYGYNQAEKISNLGPVEEARQGFLLRIHQQDVYDLFQQEKSRVEGNIYQKGQKATTRNIDEGVEKMVHNFVRSRYGISSTDKRSGLIIDDHVFAAKEILKGVKEALKIDKNADFISIASKTTNARYTGFKQFFTLINTLILYKNSNEKNEKELFDYIYNTFFKPGASLTNAITDGTNTILTDVDLLIKQSVENKK